MELEIIKVDAHNMMGVVTDPEVYVITNMRLFDKLMMRPITDASIEDILSKDNLVVRITTK